MALAHEHLSVDKDGFDAVSMEIETTLCYLGVRAQEIKAFMEFPLTSGRLAPLFA